MCLQQSLSLPVKPKHRAAESTHNNVVNAGRPRSGPIFLARNQAKYKFRLHIKNCKEKEKLLVTDKLSSELCSKNPKSFWKTWKSKFKVKDRTPTVNGLRNDDSIANFFAESIKKTCTPNCSQKNDVLLSKFYQSLPKHKFS